MQSKDQAIKRCMLTLRKGQIVKNTRFHESKTYSQALLFIVNIYVEYQKSIGNQLKVFSLKQVINFIETFNQLKCHQYLYDSNQVIIHTKQQLIQDLIRQCDKQATNITNIMINAISVGQK